MTCPNHDGTIAEGACDSCHRAFCQDCLVPLGGQTLCAGCKDERVRQIKSGVRREPTTVRRLIWNLYAWPMTPVLVLLILSELKQGGWFRIFDAVFSIPSLLGLHFHIWRVPIRFPWVWKYYAVMLAAWQLFYNLVLVPKSNGGPISVSNQLFAFGFLFPLYFALFRYAFARR